MQAPGPWYAKPRQRIRRLRAGVRRAGLGITRAETPREALTRLSYFGLVLAGALFVWGLIEAYPLSAPADRTGGSPARETPVPVPTATVLGGIPSGSTPEGETLSESFDLITMGGSLPDGWVVDGTDAEVEIAAFPTAMNRSVRIRAAETGSGLCRLLPTDKAWTAFSVLLLTDPVAAGTTFAEVTDTQGGLIRLTVTTSDQIQVQVASGSSDVGVRIDPRTLYRTTVQLKPDAVEVLIHQGSAPGALLGTADIPTDNAQLSMRQICFRVPVTDGATDLYVDEFAVASE